MCWIITELVKPQGQSLREVWLSTIHERRLAVGFYDRLVNKEELRQGVLGVMLSRWDCGDRELAHRDFAMRFSPDAREDLDVSYAVRGKSGEKFQCYTLVDTTKPGIRASLTEYWFDRCGHYFQSESPDFKPRVGDAVFFSDALGDMACGTLFANDEGNCIIDLPADNSGAHYAIGMPEEQLFPSAEEWRKAVAPDQILRLTVAINVAEEEEKKLVAAAGTAQEDFRKCNNAVADKRRQLDKLNKLREGYALLCGKPEAKK